MWYKSASVTLCLGVLQLHQKKIKSQLYTALLNPHLTHNIFAYTFMASTFNSMHLNFWFFSSSNSN